MEATTVGQEELRRLVPMSDAIEAVRESFVALRSGAFEMPTRTVLRDGAFLVMSVHHRPTASAMTKSLSLNFGNRTPAIGGTVVWSALDHTCTVMVDAVELTRIRTGAVVGVATDMMAPRESRSCTVIGAGSQAADQIRAVQSVRPLASLRIVDADQARAEKLADLIQGESPLTNIHTGTDPSKEVRDADIVCCATTATTPLFSVEDLQSETHVNAIGAFRPTMRELPDKLLAESTVIVDEMEAILAEAGDVLHALNNSVIAKDELTELGTALAEGIDSYRTRTVFKSVGVAIQDWALANILARQVLT